MNFLNALKTYLTGSGIPVVSLFSSSGNSKPSFKDDNSKNIEQAFKLGVFSLPVFFFNEIMENLKVTNPQLYPTERAAVAYFSMLALQPMPTAEYTTYYLNAVNAKTDEASNIDAWLGLEKVVHERATTEKKAIFYSSAYLGIAEDNAQKSYYNNVLRLQYWISHNGLWEGIQKTLNEQSRKLQGLRAGILESQAHAAKALAMSKITDEMTDEARVRAAQEQAQAQKEYNAAIERENELNKQLDNISKGLPADFKDGSLSAGGVPVLPLIVGGLFVFWLGTRKGRRAAR